MKKIILILLVCIIGSVSCNHIKYTPRPKNSKFQALPSIVLLDKIVEFKQVYKYWPTSKEEMAAKGKQYEEAWRGFRYLSYSFVVKQNDVLYFNFWDFPKEVEQRNRDSRFELNSYNGWVKFFKDGDVYAWKINKN